MEPADCPFRTLDRELEMIRKKVRAVIVDIHAEATSEKCALAWYADGRVSAVAGTHTHVQTADERILPCGTAFISDAGMTGPFEGIIGVKREQVIEKFRTSIPVRFEVANGAPGSIQRKSLWISMKIPEGRQGYSEFRVFSVYNGILLNFSSLKRNLDFNVEF